MRRFPGAGTSTIEIEGVTSLGGAHHAVLPDRIETGTYAMAVAMTGGDVTLEGARGDLLESALDVLERTGPRSPRSIRASASRAMARHRAGGYRDAALSGLPHRSAGPVMGLMTRAKWPLHHSARPSSRTASMHLCRNWRGSGARISLNGQTAIVEGVDRLKGAQVMATDLRASVSRW